MHPHLEICFFGNGDCHVVLEVFGCLQGVKLFQIILQFSNITILFDSIPDFGLSIFHQPSPLQFDLKQTIRLWDYLIPIPTI